MANSLDDLIGAVRVNCGDPAGTSHIALGETALTHALNWAASEVTKRTHLLEEQQSFSTIVGTMEYGFAAALYLLEGISCTLDNVPLKFQSHDQILTRYKQSADSDGTVSNSTPLYYGFRAGVLVLFPPPDEAGTNNIGLNYYADAEPMTGLTDLPFYSSASMGTDDRYLLFAEEAVTLGAEMRTWRVMGNAEKYREARGEFEGAIAAINEGLGDIPGEDVEWFDETE